MQRSSDSLRTSIVASESAALGTTYPLVEIVMRPESKAASQWAANSKPLKTSNRSMSELSAHGFAWLAVRRLQALRCTGAGAVHSCSAGVCSSSVVWVDGGVGVGRPAGASGVCVCVNTKLCGTK